MFKIKKRHYTIIGIILLIYSAILITIRVVEGTPYTLMWITHTGLFLAVIGFLLRSNFLLSSSLVGVIFYHALWVLDFLVEFVGGGKFLAMTAYLHEVSVPFFVFTLHHFWLSPLLIFVLYKKRKVDQYAWLGATGLLFVSALLSVLLTSYNVNCAHTLCPSLENTFLAGLAALSLPAYFFVGIVFNAIAIFLPINRVLRYFLEK